MTEPKTDPRPSQVTMAGFLAVVASVLLVATLFESMAQLRSVEMRESIEEFLSQSPGNGLGLSVPGTIEIIRIVTLFSGAAAAVALVLGIFVLQRSNGARLGFTLAAAAIMLTSPVSGGFLGVLIAFAAVMLWTGPARDWFAGRPSTPARANPFAHQDHTDNTRSSDARSSDARSDRSSTDANPSDANPSGSTLSGSQDQAAEGAVGSHPAPPPTQGFGIAPSQQQPSRDLQSEQQPPQDREQQQPQQPYWGPGPGGPPAYAPQSQEHPYGGGDYPAYPQQDQDKRPTTVTIAAVLTWIFSGITLLAFGVIVVALVAAKDQLLEAVQQDPDLAQLNIDPDQVIAGLWVVSAFVIFWCLASIVLAVLAWRRHNWARITLVVSAVTAALFATAAWQVGFLTILAAGATVVLLFTGGANQWYSRRGGPHGNPPHPDNQQGYQQFNQPPSYQQNPQQPPQPPDQQEPPKNVW